jgi:hypothetical protein
MVHIYNWIVIMTFDKAVMIHYLFDPFFQNYLK